jgi:AraC family transcriptional regulator
MSISSQNDQHHRRLQRVVDYIHAHLDDALDLNKLAEIACLSPYHWSRIYAALYGESIVDTVKRLRLHRAAVALAHGTDPIASIARKAGYGSVPAFSRSFRDTFGMPPATYRKAGSHTRFQSLNHQKGTLMFDVEIKTIAPIHMATIPHKGAYFQINRAFDQLFGLLGQHALFPDPLRMIAVFYDDPSVVAEADLRSRAAVAMPESRTLVAPLEPSDVIGGRYAVMHYKGPYADMPPAYHWLYGAWLAASGEELADAPSFEDYLNNPRNTAPADLLTDIYMPLKG